MSTTRNTPAFDALLRDCQQIGGRYIVEIRLSQESVDKANWLADKERDFFSVTESMKGAVAKACVEAVRQGGLATITQVAPEAIRRHIILRFARGGYDMRLRRLSPKYAAWKQKKYDETRIGILTGDLFHDVALAPISLRKVG
jgi:hypothetical protein